MTIFKALIELGISVDKLGKKCYNFALEKEPNFSLQQKKCKIPSTPPLHPAKCI
jgi:hypothetical protein